METSIFLAKVIGLFGTISILAVLVRYRETLKLGQEAAQSRLWIYTSGFFILILGILLVTSHNMWVWDWRLVITILGWTILLKGILRIFFPDAVKRLIEKKTKNGRFWIAEAAAFLIGLYLIYKGFFFN